MPENPSAPPKDPANASSSGVKSIGIMYGFKAIRLLLTYLSLTLTTNFMSQIYMEKVLVNNEEPPSLFNYLMLFVIIDVFLNIMLLLLIVLMNKLDLLGNIESPVLGYMMDYGLGMGFILLLSYIVTSTMYAKKYFMYKEDGLRAIRALSDIVMRFALIAHLLPLDSWMNKLMAAGDMTVKDLQNASAAIKSMQYNQGNQNSAVRR